MERQKTLPRDGRSGLALNILNFFLFQSVWLVTVLGAARGQTWPGIVALVVFATLHGRLAPAPKADFLLMAAAIATGFVCDSILVGSGALRVSTAFPLPGFAPLWMLVLWGNLALAIDHCLGWLRGRYLLSALLGAVGGPLAYAGGAGLGAGTFAADPAVTIGILAAAWGCVTPTLFRLAELLKGR